MTNLLNLKKKHDTLKGKKQGSDGILIMCHMACVLVRMRVRVCAYMCATTHVG